jgi:hypothetical protein
MKLHLGTTAVDKNYIHEEIKSRPPFISDSFEFLSVI